MKQTFFALGSLLFFLALALEGNAARQVINTGSAANDGTGDSLRAAGTKINANFTELYARSGTVSSVTLTVPNFLQVGTTTITTSGTFAITLSTQSANRVFAGPASGSAAAPAFRALVAADVPDLSGVYQPLDADLTAIAALTTTSFGRSVLEVSDAAAARTLILPAMSGQSGKFLTNNGTVASWGSISGGGDMVAANNLSDLTNAATARSNLGLGNVENTAVSTWAGSSNVTTLGTIATGVWHGTAIGDTWISSATSWNAKQSALTFSTGVTNSAGTVTVNTSQNVAKLSNLTSNGFVKTSGSDGTLSVDTATYLTGNQTITLSGDVSGSGATSIAVTVTKINGTALSGLATGLLANTTGTGVPVIVNFGTGINYSAPNLTLSGIANASLANAAITIAGTSTSLGGTITLDTITGLSSTGVIKRTGANTLAIATAGTDYVTPSGSGTALTGLPCEFCIACSDETTAITSGTAKVTFRAPYAFTITSVRASLTTASSSGNPTVDINGAGTTILSTKLSIDSGEKTSTTAATAAVISDASIADDAEITVDVDTAGTGAAGLKIWIIGHK